MFFQASFWMSFVWGGVGTLVGMIVIIFFLRVVQDKRNHLYSRRNLEMDFFFASSAFLVFSAAIFILTAPISNWFEICLAGFGVSGFAFRWLGVWLADRFYNKAPADAAEILSIISCVLMPVVAVGLLVGLANHYWFHVIF